MTMPATLAMTRMTRMTRKTRMTRMTRMTSDSDGDNEDDPTMTTTMMITTMTARTMLLTDDSKDTSSTRAFVPNSWLFAIKIPRPSGVNRSGWRLRADKQLLGPRVPLDG